MAIMSMSNRCFPTKAISIWLQTSDPEHIFIVVRVHTYININLYYSNTIAVIP